MFTHGAVSPTTGASITPQTPSRASRLRRTTASVGAGAVLATGLTAVAVTGLLGTYPTVLGPEQVAVLVPARPTVRDVDLSGLDPRPLLGGADQGGAPLARAPRRAPLTEVAAVAAPQRVTGFGVVGATWTGEAPEGLDFEVRTRTVGGSAAGATGAVVCSRNS